MYSSKASYDVLGVMLNRPPSDYVVIICLFKGLMQKQRELEVASPMMD